jgi:hypothetical protein
MKVARSNALAVHRPEERIESMVEEIHERLDGLGWGADIPKEVARELKALNEVLTWRCMTVFEQRLGRMEAALERIERRLL